MKFAHCMSSRPEINDIETIKRDISQLFTDLNVRCDVITKISDHFHWKDLIDCLKEGKTVVTGTYVLCCCARE